MGHSSIPCRKRLAGAGSALASTGAFLYRAAPAFWSRLQEDRKRTVAPAPLRPNPKAWPDRGVFGAWIGHSTVLLKIDGFTILTDPVFSARVGLDLIVTTIGIKRLISPALHVRELPKIDLVLLSHAHMDHFDIPSLRSLESHHTSVVTAHRTSDLLRVRRYGIVHELRWGEEQQVGRALVRAFEVNHWGARMRSDTYRGYNGYTVDVDGKRILFGGDTARTTLFRGVAGTRGADIGVMPIGAYNPWIRYHCTPEESWSMAQDARVHYFIPVHHSTFRLSQEPSYEPLERLHAIAGNQSDRILLGEIGQEFKVS